MVKKRNKKRFPFKAKNYKSFQAHYVDIKLYKGDCKSIMSDMVLKGVKFDLIVTDPPYDIKNVKAGNNSKLSSSITKSHKKLKDDDINSSIVYEEILPLLYKLQDNINIYIWCNKSQIPEYLNYYVTEKGCSFDIIKWVKTNAVPTFNNKYLSDTEYCLYFRKGGLCNPANYSDASTLFQAPINSQDKKMFGGHPTIKPKKIIDRIIKNSTEAGHSVFDPYMGSGTTGVLAMENDCSFSGIDILEKYFRMSYNRIHLERTDNWFQDV